MCLLVGIVLRYNVNTISLCSHIVPLCCGIYGEDTHLPMERYVSFCGAVAAFLLAYPALHTS